MAGREREEGELHAPVMMFDLGEQLAGLHQEAQWRSEDRNAKTLLKTPSMCVILIALHQDAVMHEHQVSGPFCVQVLSGELLFTVGDAAHTARAGEFIYADPEVPHEIKAASEASFLLSIVYREAAVRERVAGGALA